MDWKSYFLGFATPFIIALACFLVFVVFEIGVYLFDEDESWVICDACGGIRIGSKFKWFIHKHFNRRHRRLFPKFKKMWEEGKYLEYMNKKMWEEER